MKKLNRLPGSTQAELDDASKRLQEAVAEFGDSYATPDFGEGDKWSDKQIAVLKAQIRHAELVTALIEAMPPEDVLAMVNHAFTEAILEESADYLCMPGTY